VLVLRLWCEPGPEPIRARITSRTDVLKQDETVETVAGREDVMRCVTRFLDAVERTFPPTS
jgi:hypothetical protein